MSYAVTRTVIDSGLWRTLDQGIWDIYKSVDDWWKGREYENTLPSPPVQPAPPSSLQYPYQPTDQETLDSLRAEWEAWKLKVAAGMPAKQEFRLSDGVVMVAIGAVVLILLTKSGRRR